MKFVKFSISILILILCSGSAYARSKSTLGTKSDIGYVLLVEDNRVYIDHGFTDGTRVGARFSVYDKKDTARIKVVEIFEKGSAAELFTSYAQVDVRNRVKPDVKSTPLTTRSYRRRSRKSLAWFSLAVSLASGCGASYCHWRSDDPIESTNGYNIGKWSLAGTSGVALVTSLFLFIRRDNNQLISLNNSPRRGGHRSEERCWLSSTEQPQGLHSTEVCSIIKVTTDGLPYVVLLDRIF